MKDVTRLIDEIFGVVDLMPSTREDLEDFKRDIVEGELNRDDREYIIALHKRLVGGGGVAASDSDEDDDADEDEADMEADMEASLADEVEELRQALDERDQRIAELERELEEARGGETST